MNIRKTIITATVALTMVAMIAPVSASALTVADLQAQINALMAQLAQLQGTTTTTTGNVPAACAGITFSRNLRIGSTGADVKCFQTLMNVHGYQLATTGAGSPGNETTYFGPKTLGAVQKLQVAQGWASATQVGPMTRALFNSWLTGGVVTTPGQPSVPTGAGLSVMLASDNPVAGTVVSGASTAQGGADLAHLTFLNGDNAEVKVTSLKLKRTGISNDATLANVYLYDGANRLTDGASVSSGMITFNDPSGLFMVPAGSSKTIRVLVDLATGASGQTMGVSVDSASGVTTNASSVKGNFPVSGNLFTAASGSMATVSFATSTTPATASVDPQNDYTVWQNVTTISTRAVTLKRFALRQTGSALAADIKNYRLYIDGVQAGSAVANTDANGYVTFDLSANPLRVETGSRTIKVLADIIGGSSKTFIFSLRQTSDAAFTDTQFGVDVIPQANSTTFSARTTGTETINSGTLTFTKTTDSPAGNIVLSAPNAVLARYTLTAAGEPVKVTDLYVGIVDSTTAAVANFRNGALYANGVQIGSTTDVTEGDTTTGTHFSLGSSLVVDPSSPVTLEIRSDVKESSGTAVAANDSIYATIIAGSSNAEGKVSKTTISTPSANQNGNTLTVKAGALTLSKYTAYTNQSVVPPLTKTKIAHFTVTADTTEAVNITSIEANLNNVVSSYATNLYVMFGNDTTTIKPSLSAASNSWSVNYTLASGQTKDLTIWADIKSTATGTGIVSAYVSGTTASSATAVTAGTTGAYTTGTGGVQGQSIVFTTGSFTPAVDGSTPNAAIVAGGQQVVAGKFKYTSVYDTYTIQELRFTASNSAAVNSAVLMDGSTVLATVPYDSTNSYFNFTGLSLPVAMNTNKVLTLAYNLSSTLSSTTSTSQVDVEPTQSYIKYMNSQGTVSSSITTYPTSKEVYAFKSIPTVTVVPVTTSALLSGATKQLYSWKIAADAKGPIAVKQVKLNLTWTDGSANSTLQLYAFKLYKDGVNITSLVTITDEDGHDLTTSTATNGANESSSKVIIVWSTEDTIAAGGSSTYIIEATASGFAATANIVGDDGVSLNIPADTSVNASTKKFLNASATPATSVVQLATTAGASGVDANFIWSDASDVGTPHSYTVSANTATATSSGDWSNGYLVQSLPLSTTTWSGQ
ncbi:MAG: hypothetical protein HY219_01220 [Candidatus Staskawiczbacteria bacterium]|nr:hypothetical protein [Candidatus Staskawiczbacteria bacterium]